jgi:hypothetical protein
VVREILVAKLVTIAQFHRTDMFHTNRNDTSLLEFIHGKKKKTPPRQGGCTYRRPNSYESFLGAFLFIRLNGPTVWSMMYM